MIRVELGHEVRKQGRWVWTCPRYALRGISRQPLLDACRQIQRMGEDTASLVGLFREARSVPSITCSVGWGASHSVREDVTRFEKWKPKPLGHYRPT